MLACNDLLKGFSQALNHRPQGGPSAGLLSVRSRGTERQQLSYFFLPSHPSPHPTPPQPPIHPGVAVAAGMRWYLSKQTICSQRRLGRPQEAPLSQAQ